MEALLRDFASGSLSRSGERQLYGKHQRHFGKRVRVLDPAFFPGAEKSEEAYASMGNEAFASFSTEPHHEGEPAFVYTINQELSPAGFLYYWRASATIQFMRRNGPEALQDRLNLLRNVRIHLKEGFQRIPSPIGEDRWGLPHWPAAERTTAPDISNVWVDVEGKRCSRQSSKRSANR